MDNKKENVKNKVWFAEDVKKSMVASIMCTIEGDTSVLFTKNT